MKRFIAFIIVITLLPILAVIYILAIILNGLPLFFVQDRVGRDRVIFKIYKLRTMKRGKVTPFGSFLRKTALDETPQLVNIIKGEMSFIGPRPLTELDIIRLGWDSSEYDIRWIVLPGLTGISQLSPICSRDNTWKLDSLYCKTKSFKLDIIIIIQTIIKIFKGKTENR